MRGSIKRQISVIFIGLVVAILLISLGVNAKFSRTVLYPE